MSGSKESFVWQALVDMGNQKLLRMDEVKELPRPLEDNELPRVLVPASCKDSWMENTEAGILVTTDWRILFVYVIKSGLFGKKELRTQQFPHSAITSN